MGVEGGTQRDGGAWTDGVTDFQRTMLSAVQSKEFRQEGDLRAAHERGLGGSEGRSDGTRFRRQYPEIFIDDSLLDK